MIRLVLLFALFFSVLHAGSPSFEEIKNMPSSYAKDYYIWQFLQKKKTTKKEALEAYQWTKRKGPKLKKAIRKKVGHTPKNLSKKVRAKRDPNNYIIYPATAAKKSKNTLKKLYAKIQKQGKYSETLHIMSNDKPFETLALFAPKTQAYVFNNVGTKYRKSHFNKAFTKEQLKGLVAENQFNTSIHKIVTTHALDKLKKSLILIGENNLTFKSNFYLAVNAVEFNETKKALTFLDIARSKTSFQSQYDQVDFWRYLLTNDKKYLQRLVESHQINIYTLKARDILKKPYPKVMTPNLAVKQIEGFDIANPIDWENLKVEIKKNPNNLDALAKKYESSETLGIYAYIKEKASKYQVPYYAMPYREAMWGFSTKRTALLYAIGRQESRLVPASVSPSYALGMMQIMPFLIRHLAKERKEKLDLNDMFKPRVAIAYANQHMNYLNKWLYNPLFIAYAYNGGIGFTRRTINSSHLFKTGKYEPYLSMELVDYSESREYGKKVLTDYVIYLNILGKKTTVSSFLDELDKPLLTDRFR